MVGHFEGDEASKHFLSEQCIVRKLHQRRNGTRKITLGFAC
jgi:hypothetical protein